MIYMWPYLLIMRFNTIPCGELKILIDIPKFHKIAFENGEKTQQTIFEFIVAHRSSLHDMYAQVLGGQQIKLPQTTTYI